MERYDKKGTMIREGIFFMMPAKRYMRYMVLAVIGLIAFALAGCGGSSEDGTNETVDPEAAKTAFLEWEARVTEIHTAADEVLDAYNQAVTKLSEGRVDIFSAYDYISNEVIPTNEKLERAMDLIRASDAFSRKHRETLNSASSDLANGIYWRTKGFKRFLEFLDSQKLSLMDKVKGDFEFANDYMLEGIAKYIGVKMELGLIEDEQKEQKDQK
jgi:hypothetical protein